MKNIEIVDETIVWNKVENKMPASQGEAPYLGVIQARDTVTFGAFVQGVKDGGCSESEHEISRILTKHEELMKGYVAQNYKVYSPFGLAGVHLTKSFPTQDAPFDPTVNEAVMSIRTNAETRNALKGVKLKEDKAAAAVLKGPKFNSVCTGGTRFGVIVCYQPFTAAGKGLCLDPSNPADRLTLASEKTGEVTEISDYTCDGEGFRIDAKVMEALAPGKYALTAHVDMGDAEHPYVLTATIKVTVEAGEAPTGPRITGVGGDTRVSKSAGDLTVSGVNLAERREDWGDGETRLELNIKKSPDDVWNTLSPSAEFGIVDPCDAHTVTLKASELYSSAFTIDDPVPGQEYPLKLVAYVNGVKANEFEFTGIGA